MTQLLDHLSWRAWLCIGTALACLAYAALGGCGLGVDLTVGVKLDDKCLTYLPTCVGENFSCGVEEPDGRWVTRPECRVGCAAGRTLMCEADGPSCEQRVGSSEEWVPVFCVSRQEE